MKNKQQTTNNKQRTYKAFTLLELVVSIALLAIIFLFAGVIFKVSINSYRTSVANAEIMQKLRAITDQLNADFKGIVLGAPGRVSFAIGQSVIDGQVIDVRQDGIASFSIGDFQSTGQYTSGSSKKTVVGDVAGIFYGLANISATDPREKILVRRQTILLTPDSSFKDANSDPRGEYYKKSLSQWKVDFRSHLYDVNELTTEEQLDPSIDADFDKLSVKYMAKGVDNFTIQYVGTEDPPDLSKKFNEWRPDNRDVTTGWTDKIYPIALKFTFTLYDSKAIIKQGRTFTHIVYLGD
jgi:prepilin-type N-terminal cleavage/methylation domain-containing protein